MFVAMGSVEQNVRYCNDRQDCIDRAPLIVFGRPPKKFDASKDVL